MVMYGQAHPLLGQRVLVVVKSVGKKKPPVPLTGLLEQVDPDFLVLTGINPPTGGWLGGKRTTGPGAIYFSDIISIRADAS